MLSTIELYMQYFLHRGMTTHMTYIELEKVFGHSNADIVFVLNTAGYSGITAFNKMMREKLRKEPDYYPPKNPLPYRDTPYLWSVGKPELFDIVVAAVRAKYVIDPLLCRILLVGVCPKYYYFDLTGPVPEKERVVIKRDKLKELLLQGYVGKNDYSKSPIGDLLTVFLEGGIDILIEHKQNTPTSREIIEMSSPAPHYSTATSFITCTIRNLVGVKVMGVKAQDADVTLVTDTLDVYRVVLEGVTFVSQDQNEKIELPLNGVSEIESIELRSILTNEYPQVTLVFHLRSCGAEAKTYTHSIGWKIKSGFNDNYMRLAAYRLT